MWLQGYTDAYYLLTGDPQVIADFIVDSIVSGIEHPRPAEFKWETIERVVREVRDDIREDPIMRSAKKHVWNEIKPYVSRHLGDLIEAVEKI